MTIGNQKIFESLCDNCNQEYTCIGDIPYCEGCISTITNDHDPIQKLVFKLSRSELECLIQEKTIGIY